MFHIPKSIKYCAFVLSLSGFVFSSSADLDSGLVRYMKFSEGSGSYTYDSSGNGGHYWISLPDSAWTNNGFVGKGLHFKGWWGSNPNYDCIRVVDSALPHVDTLTVAAWVKIDSLVCGYMKIASKGNDNRTDGLGDEWGFGVTHDVCDVNHWNLEGYIKVQSNDVRHGVGGGVVYPDQWTFVCMRYDGDSLKLYVNGEIVASTGQWISGRKIVNGGGLGRIGWWTMSDPIAMQAFHGTIDEVRVYNRALSENEILELYCNDKVYVDSAAIGNNNGTSWTNAYTNLKQAIDSATPGTMILVSKGSYFPTNTTDRSISFQMKQGTVLYGGFNTSTGDTSFSTRDCENNPTILSGDIGVVEDSTDNSYHVVVGSNNSVIDGFTIKFGNAWYNWDGTNVDYGGGILNVSSSPIISRCNFNRNHGRIGGAIANKSNSAPIIIECQFSENSAAQIGGAIANWHSNPYIEQCMFYKNGAEGYLSALSYGGAIYNRDTSCANIINCSFNNNFSRDRAGAVYNGYFSNLNISNCSFFKNTASSPTSLGGAIYNVYHCTTLVSNSILWNDSARYGGEIYSDPNQNELTKLNCNDIDGGLLNSIKVYLQKDIQDLGGNINSNPLYNNPNYNDLNLQSNSPCIDIGDNGSVKSSTDLAGNTRIKDGDGNESTIVDMGAYEKQ